MKKSTINITLVLIGAFALNTNCERSDDRHIYKTKEDCIADWGRGEDCEPVKSGSSHSHIGTYYGPYYSSYGNRTPRSNRSAGSVSVKRGGFGSFSSSRSSGS